MGGGGEGVGSVEDMTVTWGGTDASSVCAGPKGREARCYMWGEVVMGWEAGVLSLSVMPGGVTGVGTSSYNTWELGPAAGIHFSDKSAGRTWPDTTATLMAPTLMSASYTIHHAASWGYSVGDSARQISGAEDGSSVRKTRRESHKAT